MITKITGEQPFQVLTNNFSISPSNEGYTLQISADGKQYSNLFSVGAGVTRLVTGVAANSFYRLLGNQSEVSVNWMKTCVTEGGSGSGASYTAGDYIDITEDIISVTGITPDEYLTSADTANFALSADVATLSAATVGKADAANVTPNNVRSFPRWNAQGVITGTTGDTVSQSVIDFNGQGLRGWFRDRNGGFGFYAPTTSGNPGDILVSTGNDAPVWSGVTIPENPVQSLSIDTIWKGTQDEYEALASHDPNTFYIIVAE